VLRASDAGSAGRQSSFAGRSGAYEWRSAASEQVLVSHAFVPSHPGAAPPLSLSLIFG
jgi:hypothetical protein